MTGYSGTSLSRKLGIKTGFKIYIKQAPENHLELLFPLPDEVKILQRASGNIDIIHIFSKSKNDLHRNIEALINRLSPKGAIWISWPKQTSREATDLNVSVIREVARPFKLVDTKVCAIDKTWSGLRFVKRKSIKKSF